MVFWGTKATLNGWELIHVAEPLTLCVMVPSLLNGGTCLSLRAISSRTLRAPSVREIAPLLFVCACERLMGSAYM